MILLVLFPIVQSGSFYLKQYESIQKVSDQTNSHSALKAPENPPDIYYIILDMYTRQDALLNDYHFDNSTFLDELNQLGFYVAPCSRSNYDETTKSLASSLNMNYLPALNPEIKPGENDPTLVTSLLSNNKVRNLLQGMGYKTVAFETGYAWDSWTDADVYLKPQYGSSLLRQMRPFEALLIKTTALDALSDMGSIISKSYLNTINAPLAEHINRQEYILNKLNSLATLKGPKFVFAHILIPHYPFIFKADGSIQTDVNYYRDQNVPSSEAYFIDGYQNQVAFINSQIIPIVKSILSQSKTPPIIIIQGDHGAKDANRLENLNAYYLPGGKGNLYSSISPVNSFRLIFDQYFGGTYPLLPDVSYASSMNDPYGFTAQPEESLSCRP
jgi:hypothetical protein